MIHVKPREPKSDRSQSENSFRLKENISENAKKFESQSPEEVSQGSWSDNRRNEFESLLRPILNFMNRPKKLEEISKLSKTMIYSLEYEKRNDPDYLEYKYQLRNDETLVGTKREDSAESRETIRDLARLIGDSCRKYCRGFAVWLGYLLVVLSLCVTLIQFLKTDYVFLLEVESYIMYVVKLVPFVCYCVQQPLLSLFLFSLEGAFNILMTSIWLFWEIVKILNLDVVKREIGDFMRLKDSRFEEGYGMGDFVLKAILLVGCFYFLGRKIFDFLVFLRHKIRFRRQYFYRKKIVFSRRVDPAIVKNLFMKVLSSFNLFGSEKFEKKDFLSRNIPKQKTIYFCKRREFFFFQIKREENCVVIEGAFPGLKENKLRNTLRVLDSKISKLQGKLMRKKIFVNHWPVIDYLNRSGRSAYDSGNDDCRAELNPKSGLKESKSIFGGRKRAGSCGDLDEISRGKFERRNSVSFSFDRQMSVREVMKKCKILGRKRKKKSLLGDKLDFLDLSLEVSDENNLIETEQSLKTKNQKDEDSALEAFKHRQKRNDGYENYQIDENKKEALRKTADSLCDLDFNSFPVFDLPGLESTKHKTLNRYLKEKIEEYNSEIEMMDSWELDCEKKYETKVYKKSVEDFITRMSESVCDLDIDDLFETVLDKSGSVKWMDSLSMGFYFCVDKKIYSD